MLNLPVISLISKIAESSVTVVRIKHWHYIYHPHPQDGEGTVFTGVCLSTPGGCTPILGSFQVTGLRSFLGLGYPIPGSFPGLLVPGALWLVPQFWPGVGYPRMEYSPPGQDWGTPSARTGVLPESGQDWRNPWPGEDGVPPKPGLSSPPPAPQDRTAERALATLLSGRDASCVHAEGLSCVNNTPPPHPQCSGSAVSYY